MFFLKADFHSKIQFAAEHFPFGEK